MSNQVDLAAAAAAQASAEAAGQAEAMPRPSQSSLYVGDLDDEVVDADLLELFGKIGEVVSCRVCRDRVTTRSLHYGYVNFARAADAEQALEDLNFYELKQKQIRVMWNLRDPTLRRSGNGNIFINHLAEGVGNKELYDTFSQFGSILSAKVVTDEAGKSLGYGYVHFVSPQSAEMSIDKVNGMAIMGKVVSVTRFVRSSDRTKNSTQQNWTNVYVKHLDESMSQDAFVALFSMFGDIISARLMLSDSGQSRCFGFVAFKNHEQARNAVELMHGMRYMNKNLYVGRAMTKAERLRELAKRTDDYQRSFTVQNNVYIRNLHESIDDEQLKQSFAPFGRITSAKVMRDESGASRGFGFVCYATGEEAGKAINRMNGAMLMNKPLTVCIAQRREYRRQHLAAMRMQGPMMFMPSFGAGGPVGPVPVGPGGMGPGMPQMQPGLFGNNPNAQYMFGQRQFMFPPVVRSGNWNNARAPGGFNAVRQYTVPVPQRRNVRRNVVQQGVPGAPVPQQGSPTGPGVPQQQAGGPNGRMVPGPGQQQQQHHNASGRGRGGLRYGGGNRLPREGGPQMMGGMPMNMPPNMMMQPGQGYPAGMMPYNSMPVMQQQGPQQVQQAQPMEPLNPSMLANASKEQQMELIGNYLYAEVMQLDPERASIVTGVLLANYEISELLSFLDNRSELNIKVGEVINQLNERNQQDGQVPLAENA